MSSAESQGDPDAVEQGGAGEVLISFLYQKGAVGVEVLAPSPRRVNVDLSGEGWSNSLLSGSARSDSCVSPGGLAVCCAPI